MGRNLLFSHGAHHMNIKLGSLAVSFNVEGGKRRKQGTPAQIKYGNPGNVYF